MTLCKIAVYGDSYVSTIVCNTEMVDGKCPNAYMHPPVEVLLQEDVDAETVKGGVVMTLCNSVVFGSTKCDNSEIGHTVHRCNIVLVNGECPGSQAHIPYQPEEPVEVLSEEVSKSIDEFLDNPKSGTRRMRPMELTHNAKGDPKEQERTLGNFKDDEMHRGPHLGL